MSKFNRILDSTARLNCLRFDGLNFSGMINVWYYGSSGAELREIQKQIENLPHPTDPRTVADFLAMRRDVMFLEFDTAVRHCMMDTFLSTGNVQSFHVSTHLPPNGVHAHMVIYRYSTT